VTKDLDPTEYAKSLGYTDEELRGVPEGTVCHGCGNPIALADLKEGESVLDLGSGGGLDAFLAARRVGPQGKVIGVDSSPEMVAKAIENAALGRYSNVMFRVGQMEQLPLGDQSVDVVISNCVINHAADKLAVFRELLRCLRHNGRMILTDLVLEGQVSDAALQDEVWGQWLATASGKRDYLDAIQGAGFRDVTVVAEATFPRAEADERLRGKIVSTAVKAGK
jgi:arsenite methyltransferase